MRTGAFAKVPTMIGAGHATDIPFFFDTVDVRYQGSATPRDRGMGKVMTAYLVNFARSGNPNDGQLPIWPRYSRATDVIANLAEDQPSGSGRRR